MVCISSLRHGCMTCQGDAGLLHVHIHFSSWFEIPVSPEIGKLCHSIYRREASRLNQHIGECIRRLSTPVPRRGIWFFNATDDNCSFRHVSWRWVGTSTCSFAVVVKTVSVRGSHDGSGISRLSSLTNHLRFDLYFSTSGSERPVCVSWLLAVATDVWSERTVGVLCAYDGLALLPSHSKAAFSRRSCRMAYLFSVHMSQVYFVVKQLSWPTDVSLKLYRRLLCLSSNQAVEPADRSTQ